MFNRRIQRLGTVFLALALLLSLRIVWWQMVRPDPVAAVRNGAGTGVIPGGGSGVEVITGSSPEALEAVPAPVLQRARKRLENLERGAIYDRRGRLLAYNSPDGGRVYTTPSLAPVIGYVSGIGTGVAGIEAGYNESLLGLDRLETQARLALRQAAQGSSLALTIDSAVQQAAVDALGGQAGAVVVLDAHSGAVLAMVSNPHYDPNRVLEPGYAASLEAACGGQPACRAPFVNRATQARYTPGSTWKTVTLIAALDSGQVTPETVFDFGEPRQGPNGPYYVYEVGGGEIPDPNHREARLDLPMAYARSANAAFARIGDEMAPETFREYAARLGFGAPGEIEYSLGIEYTPSQVANDPAELAENDLLRAATAIGQGELLTSPLNMALVAAAVINDGDLPLPRVVESARLPSAGGVALPALRIGQEVNVMEPAAAEQAQAIMVTAVESGSGSPAQIPGVRVGGKTGTAQLGGDQAPHAWFIGFAEQDRQAVAIAVLVEHGGSGFSVAAPLFARVAPAALQALADPVEFTPEQIPE
ncbi:MAG TPA: penicillin-binding protein 2 [Anaerolineaceae bacterium]|nr:penicillin-binding protein 2 [Anaerolineaceae bacterium]